MRFLGVHPGPLLYSRIFLRLEPLGLELVAQAARRSGHAVQLIDLQVEDHAAYFRMLEEFRPESIMRFSRNPNYWQKGIPRFDGVEIYNIKDENAALAARLAEGD